MAKVIWKQIPGFEYEVSNFGKVRSLERLVPHQGGRYRVRARVLKQQTNTYGYLHVTLFKNSKRYMRLVHHLVLEVFVGPCPPGMQCRHLDGNRTNNRRSNLRWGTQTENEIDKKRHGTTYRPIGEKNSQSRLTAKIASDILKADGSQSKIALMFNVSRSCVAAIKRRERWKHL